MGRSAVRFAAFAFVIAVCAAALLRAQARSLERTLAFRTALRAATAGHVAGAPDTALRPAALVAPDPAVAPATSAPDTTIAVDTFRLLRPSPGAER